VTDMHLIVKKSSNNRKALIVLHEIYGINRFTEDICDGYNVQGFDIFCPDMLNGNRFLYTEASRAYDSFIDEVGFDYYGEIEQLLERLKITYDKVFIIGFSVGATIAWRCCDNAKSDGIICCYGSRIRDYLSLQPSCPVLLLFAEQDSFDVGNIVEQILEKRNVEVHKLKASHGFMDQYSDNFNGEEAQAAQGRIRDFLEEHS